MYSGTDKIVVQYLLHVIENPFPFLAVYTVHALYIDEQICRNYKDTGQIKCRIKKHICFLNFILFAKSGKQLLAIHFRQESFCLICLKSYFCNKITI
jgi:hypothetical protein